MGFDGFINSPDEDEKTNNNNNNVVVDESYGPKRPNRLFTQIAERIRKRQIEAALAKKASEDHAARELNSQLHQALVESSLNIDTVFGYDFEYHRKVKDKDNQILHPSLTAGSTFFGYILASVMHGRITLPRVQSEASQEDAQWLIYAADRFLYCISLAELRAKDNVWHLPEDADIALINAKLKELNIERYGWASHDKKERLIPHSYVTYVDAFLASSISLPFYLVPAPYNLFGFIFTMGIFFYRLHRQLETIHYQKHQKGARPSIAEGDIIWRDSLTIGMQTGFAATVTTLMMNIELHEAIGFNMSDAFSCVLPNFLPVCAVLTLSLITGLALGAALVGIAKASRSKDNQYTQAQLARVFAAGFLAGALIYPFMMAAAKTSQPFISTLFLEYVISISLGSALHFNVKNRLDVEPKKTVLFSKIHKTESESNNSNHNPHSLICLKQ